MVAVVWILAVQVSLVILLFGSGYLDRRGEERVQHAIVRTHRSRH